MSKHALVVAALALLPFLGSCSSCNDCNTGDDTRVRVDDGRRRDDCGTETEVRTVVVRRYVADDEFEVEDRDDGHIAHDGRPQPGNGDCGEYVSQWWTFQRNHLTHAAHSLHWMFLNTNSEDVPYERWHDDQLPRAFTTIVKTVDTHLLNYDWDDPFMGARW